MKITLSNEQREDAVNVCVRLFALYAEEPGEHIVTQSLMFILNDLVEARRAQGVAEPLANLPKLIIQNNPAQFRYTVVISTATPPFPNDDTLSFIHQNDIREAAKRFTEAANSSTQGWISLWDNDRRLQIGELRLGGES